MNRSYSKIRHIQEANRRLESRLIKEQTPYEIGGDLSRAPSDNFEFSDEWFDMRAKNSKLSQIKDIIDNFDSINCEGVNQSSEESLFGEVPEWNTIYCSYYQGKSKEDMMALLDSMLES